MKDYTTANIRNIAVVGHGSDGKTTLVEALLYVTGAIDRQGRVEDGTATTDYDQEELKRHISISAAVAPLEFNETKINLIDVPGYFDFAGEMVGPMAVADGALITAERRVRSGRRRREGLRPVREAQPAPHVCRQPDGSRERQL